MNYSKSSFYNNFNKRFNKNIFNTKHTFKFFTKINPAFQLINLNNLHSKLKLNTMLKESGFLKVSTMIGVSSLSLASTNSAEFKNLNSSDLFSLAEKLGIDVCTIMLLNTLSIQWRALAQQHITGVHATPSLLLKERLF